MPSKSKKQHNLMEAVAHNPAFAKKVGIPQSVGKDFSEADRGRKFSHGGSMKKESKAMMGKEIAFMKKKKAPASMMKHEMEESAMGMKRGGAAMRGQGIALRGYAKGGGVVTEVPVRGVGAARARSAKIC
jgi:hypothetical protein